mmetsp:Transcript_19915/g.57720  ORF Transcript_19915/g.57720 Transcript_19915/m.57720 type:complete len:126 (-) Transcript_19915:327-704(-)
MLFKTKLGKEDCKEVATALDTTDKAIYEVSGTYPDMLVFTIVTMNHQIKRNKRIPSSTLDPGLNASLQAFLRHVNRSKWTMIQNTEIISVINAAAIANWRREGGAGTTRELFAAVLFSKSDSHAA